MASTPELLEVLDRSVRRGARRRDLTGRIAIGVRTPEGACWWTAELGESARTAFVDAPARDVHAALLLDWTAAQGLVHGAPGAGESHVFGDRELLTRVFDHYLGKQDLVSIRAGSNHKEGISRGSQKHPRR